MSIIVNGIQIEAGPSPVMPDPMIAMQRQLEAMPAHIRQQIEGGGIEDDTRLSPARGQGAFINTAGPDGEITTVTKGRNVYQAGVSPEQHEVNVLQRESEYWQERFATAHDTDGNIRPGQDQVVRQAKASYEQVRTRMHEQADRHAERTAQAEQNSEVQREMMQAQADEYEERAQLRMAAALQGTTPEKLDALTDRMIANRRAVSGTAERVIGAQERAYLDRHLIGGRR